MEITTMTYACSPSVLSQASLGAHSALAAGTRTAYGRGLGMTGGPRVTAPFATEVEGTSVSIAMRDKTVAPTAAATVLLPISDVVVDDVAGIRTWSPPV